MEALARRSRHPAHPGPLGKSPSTLSFPRANPKGTFQVRHQRTQPLGSGPHGPPSSCPQRVCVQWCTPSLSPLGSPVVCRGVRFPFDGAGPCSQPAPPLPHAPEFVIITIPLNTYTTTLRVIRRLRGRGGNGVVRSIDRSIERSGNGAATDRQRIGLFSLNVPAAVQWINRSYSIDH